MGKLFFDKINEKIDKFYEKGFGADEGFYIKVKGKTYTGEVKVGEDNKPQMEFNTKHTHEIHDVKVTKDITIRSSGNFTFKGIADLSKFRDRVWFSHTHNWSPITRNYDATFSLESNHIEKLHERFDFMYFKGVGWRFKPNLSYQLCSKNSVFCDFTYNCGEGVREINFGLMHKPNDKMRTVLTRTAAGKIESWNDWFHTGTISLRSILMPSDKTTLGFDYKYSLATKQSSMNMGIESKIQDGFVVKGKIYSCGNMQTSARLALNDHWDLTLAVGAKANDIAGKHKSSIGIGLEGRL